MGHEGPRELGGQLGPCRRRERNARALEGGARKETAVNMRRFFGPLL